MAAAGPLPAMPAPVKLAKTDNIYRKQHQALDAKLLQSKLEAHRRKQNENQQSFELQVVAKPDQPKRASYVPRNAAKHFASTTTVKDKAEATRDMKRAASTTRRAKPEFTADGKPCVNPKQLHAALNLGMSESEVHAAAAANEVPKRRSSSLEHSGKRSSEHSRSSNDSATVPQRSASARGYKPGDAAKRNAVKRASMVIQPQGRLIAIKHGSQTTYEREYTLEFGDPANKSDPFNSAIAEEDGENDEPIGTVRPRLAAGDRHNWAQASQAGDDMRSMLHPHWRRRKSATETDADSKGRRPRVARQQSLGEIPENLVSDAVKLIKKETKAKRRESIVGFFKRL